LHPGRLLPICGYTQSQAAIITRAGGLFVRPPALPESGGEAVDARLAFKEEAARLFNLLICELCLYGMNSEPASSIVIAVGRFKDGRAFTSTAAYINDIHNDRTSGVLTNIRSSYGNDEEVLDRIATMFRAKQLANISVTLPTFTAGAYYQYSRRHFGEALIDSFVVIEQILDSLWKSYISKLPNTDEPNTKKDEGRKKRLEDTRTYSVSVRAEVLFTAGTIEAKLYNPIQKARKHRNKTAHRAKISPQAAEDCLKAMQATVEFVCQCKVAEPLTTEGIIW